MRIYDNLSFTAELKRKGIHLFSSFLPLFYYFFLNREQILIISCTISICFIVAEIIRFKSSFAEREFIKIFGPLLRKAEVSAVTGATYLFIAATLCFFLFERSVAVTAVLIMTVSDSVASIIGKAMPSIQIYKKTLAGSLGFLFSSLLIVLIIFPEIGLDILYVVIPVTFAEALPLKINDNILISVLAGILLTLVIP